MPPAPPAPPAPLAHPVASGSTVRHRTVDYHAPPESPPASQTHTIPIPPNLFHFVPKEVPLYGNKDAPIRELLLWYEEIFASRSESLDSRAAHDAAIAARASAKKAYEATGAFERSARDRVMRADRRCLRANGAYTELQGRVYVKDKGVSDPVGVKNMRKRRDERVKARTAASGSKGKGKERAIEVDIDEEIALAEEVYGSGGEDHMDLDK